MDNEGACRLQQTSTETIIGCLLSSLKLASLQTDSTSPLPVQLVSVPFVCPHNRNHHSYADKVQQERRPEQISGFSWVCSGRDYVSVGTFGLTLWVFMIMSMQKCCKWNFLIPQLPEIPRFDHRIYQRQPNRSPVEKLCGFLNLWLLAMASMTSGFRRPTISTTDGCG